MHTSPITCMPLRPLKLTIRELSVTFIVAEIGLLMCTVYVRLLSQAFFVDLINLKLVLVYKCRKLRSSWWSCTLWCAATTTCCWPSWSSRHSCAPSSSLRGARWCRLADPSLLVSLARVQAGCISLSAAACVHRLFVYMCLVHIFPQHCDATRSSLAPQCCRTI